MFETIHIEGFRRLVDVKLKLGPLNVLIGANGCGKTSLLDVFSLLAESASGRLNKSIAELGGMSSILTRLQTEQGEKADHMAFRLRTKMEVPASFDYRIQLAAQGHGFQIADEDFLRESSVHSTLTPLIHASSGTAQYLNPTGNWDFSFKIPGFNRAESALSQSPKTQTQAETETFRSHLASSTHYHVFDTNRRAPIRLPQPMQAAELPGLNGEDLVSCLYMMRETDPDRFETIEATLQAGFPSFERLNFPPVAAGTLAMTWKDAEASVMAVAP